jgi:hypothetical protein
MLQENREPHSVANDILHPRSVPELVDDVLHFAVGPAIMGEFHEAVLSRQPRDRHSEGLHDQHRVQRQHHRGAGKGGEIGD